MVTDSKRAAAHAQGKTVAESNSRRCKLAKPVSFGASLFWNSRVRGGLETSNFSSFPAAGIAVACQYAHGTYVRRKRCNSRLWHAQPGKGPPLRGKNRGVLFTDSSIVLSVFLTAKTPRRIPAQDIYIASFDDPAPEFF
jgi:hypothetical protein